MKEPKKWHLCTGCGAWQQHAKTCQQCRWSRLIAADKMETTSSGQLLKGSSIRVLVDIQLRANGLIRVTRIHTERLISLKHDSELLKKLEKEVQRFSKSSPNFSGWNKLRNECHKHIFSEIKTILEESSFGISSETKTPAIPLELSFRAFMLNKKKEKWSSEKLPWVEIVSMNNALSRNGQNFSLRNLKVNFFDTQLRLEKSKSEKSGSQLRLSITSPTEILIKKIELVLSQSLVVIWESPKEEEFLIYSAPTTLDFSLPARVLWELSPEKSGYLSLGAELRFEILGYRDSRKKTKKFVIPCGELGHKKQLVDVFFDLGSTMSKYVTRIEGSFQKQRSVRTSRIIEEWNLQTYKKSTFLSDPTGAKWAAWIADFFKALRKYAAKKHTGYLGSLHITLPESKNSQELQISSVANVFDDPNANISARLDQKSFLSLRETIQFSTVTRKKQVLFLHLEHKALAHHYFTPLRTLFKVITDLKQKYDQEKRKQKTWDQKKKEEKIYDDSSWFFYQIWNSRPSGPTGNRPNPTNLEEWMFELLEMPDYLDRVILFDAGGFTLDYSAIEGTTLTNISGSDIECGGEKLSNLLLNNNFSLKRKLKRKNPEKISSEMTNYKATFGKNWKNTNSELSDEERMKESGGQEQYEYQNKSKQVYDEIFEKIMKKCKRRWQENPCLIIFTGGAAKNPHFQEFALFHAKKVGLIIRKMEASALNKLIESAKKDPNSSELHSENLNLFSMIYNWSKMEGATTYRYDKYAVVGGLIQLEK